MTQAVPEDSPSPTDFTMVLVKASDGDSTAASSLFPLVYEELRSLAARYLRNERPDHTLQATALVHEAFIKLVKPSEIEWKSRGHFFAIAAKAMRRILVNHAKAHGRHKRGGGKDRIELDEAVHGIDLPDLNLVALDEALDRLEELDNQKARIVELRFFAGLTIEETAQTLDTSERTVRRDWTMAKAWLRGEIAQDDELDSQHTPSDTQTDDPQP